MENANIQWWRPNTTTENFGDFLTTILRDQLFEAVRIEASVYHLIGSVIDADRITQELAGVGGGPNDRILFWGCGCRTDAKIVPYAINRAIFCGVRGPLSRSVLDLPLDTPLGDPGLLMPFLYQARPCATTQDRLVCIPHINDKLDPRDQLAKTGADTVVSPRIHGSRRSLEQFIDQICAARFVLCGSLHAAVIACAYGIPFCYMDTGHLDIPFKWRDFSASVNIGSFFATNVRDGETIYHSVIRPNLKIPHMMKMLEVAPFHVKPAIMEAVK